MRKNSGHLPVVFLVIYVSFFGGVVETHPVMKIVHHAGSGLVMALWIADLRRRGRSFPITRLNGPLWALGGGWLLVSLLGENPRVSLELVWYTFFHIVLFFLFVDLIRSGHRRWLMEGLFLTGGVIVILGGIEMLFWYVGIPALTGTAQSWPEIAGYTVPPVIRELSLPLNYNNPTGAYAVVLIPLALMWAETTRETDLRWGQRALAGSLLVVALLTQSRGAYLALAALIGTMGLILALRPDVRARLPRQIRPLATPPLVLAVAAAGAVMALWVMVRLFITPSPPNPNDVARLDLWYSAVEMFEDHPLIGVGLFQFKAVRLSYGHWPHSQSYLPLNHAHNSFFTVLAEGGTLMLALSLALLVRMGRVWWAAWTHASALTRRRLEGALAALAAFGAHNMVDSFFQSQLMIPILIMLAYVAASDARIEAQPERPQPRRAKVQLATVVALLVIGELAFIPVARGALKQQRFNGLVSDGRYAEALTVIRQAQDADPWLDLYPLEEAEALGHLADRDPGAYLAAAIDAFRTSLELAPAWDSGWHNLAALYAQAGDYPNAVAAEQRAYQLSPPVVDYQLKLGEYHERAGNPADAQAIFVRLLADEPWVASSGFWRAPDHPGRWAAVNDAIEQAAGTEIALDLLVYSGQFERAAALRGSLTVEGDPGLADRIDALWPGDAGTPCLYCYHVIDNPELLEAEVLFHAGLRAPGDLDRIETLARKAIFLRGVQSPWGWYLLVRLDDRRGTRSVDLDEALSRSVAFGRDYRSQFDEIYHVLGVVEVIPQARTPQMRWPAYEPWLRLAAWEAGQGQDEDSAAHVEAVLKADPYARQLPGPRAVLSAIDLLERLRRVW